MRTPRSLRIPAILVGLLAAAGGLVVLWGSQDAMRVLIHWVGEERALGPQNVYHNRDGSTSLTNPAAMMLWCMPIWAAGASQVAAGVFLVVHSARSMRDGMPGRGPRAG